MKRVMAPLAALILGLSALIATPQQADAGRGGRVAFGIAAGLIGGALLYDHFRYRRGYYGGYGYQPYYAYHRPYYAPYYASYAPFYWHPRRYRVRYNGWHGGHYRRGYW